MAQAALKDTEELTIPVTAREALDAADGDVVKATEIMTARVLKDPTLYRPLMDPLVKNACYSAITAQCHSQRRTIWNAAQPSAEHQRNRVVALAGGTMNTLMDFPLPGGMKLADAKRDDVTAAADFYGKQSKDMGSKAKWLQLIAQHVPAKKTVKQVLTDARLAELRQEATNE